MYADDIQLYKSFDHKSATRVLRDLEMCIVDIHDWLEKNQLCLNPAKTELLLVGKLPPGVDASISVNGHIVKAVTSTKSLGVIVDSSLSLRSHISNISRNCYMRLRAIKRIKKALDHSTTKCLVHAFVISRLDYCNSLLFGLPACTLRSLQRVQYAAARVVGVVQHWQHMMPVLQDLHWLPVSYRCQYKICCYVHHCLHGISPNYLCSLISLPTSVTSRSLRSNHQYKLYRVRARTALGARRFSVSAPMLWNDLPDELRLTNDYDQFRKRLKTHLFSVAFDNF